MGPFLFFKSRLASISSALVACDLLLFACGCLVTLLCSCLGLLLACPLLSLAALCVPACVSFALACCLGLLLACLCFAPTRGVNCIWHTCRSVSGEERQRQAREGKVGYLTGGGGEGEGGGQVTWWWWFCVSVYFIYFFVKDWVCDG